MFIFLGQNISIGYGTHIYAGPNSKVTIGDNTMIGPYVFITTEAFSESKDNPEGVHSGHSGDVEIGPNVRIGAHSNILPGVRIGADSYWQYSESNYSNEERCEFDNRKKEYLKEKLAKKELKFFYNFF